MKMTLNLSGLLALLFISNPSYAQTQNRQAEANDHDSEKVTIGLALNAGSNTAGNGCAGFMRGFQQQKVTINGEQRPAMEAFDLISGSSGGNLPNMVYHYAPFTTSDEILDAEGINDPSMITMEDLEVIPEKSMFTQFVTNPLSSIIQVLAIVIATNAPSIWPVLISFVSLQPFGIALNTKMEYARIRHDVKSTPLFLTSMVGPADAYPNYIFHQMSRGFHTEYYENYLNRSECFWVELEMEWYQFFQTSNDYLLELAEKHGYMFPIPAFATHKGLEIPLMQKASLTFDNIENKNIDSVEFEPVDATFADLSSESDPFTMDKTLGMATDLSVLSGGPYFWDYLGVPPSYQDPMTLDIPTADKGKRKMVFSDGGYNDGCGVPPLVNKKTKKIISLSTPSPGALGWYEDDGGPERASDILRELEACHAGYFGIHPFVNPHHAKDDYATPDPLWFEAAHINNHMFNVIGSNGENHFKTLLENLISLRAAGEPMITTLKNIEVVDNPFYGIEGGWTLDLTVVVNIGVPGKFAEQIPDGIVTPPPGRDIIEHNFFTNEVFATVPNVMADNEFPDNSLPVKPARMTQIMNSWIIAHAWEGPLIGDDGEEKFGGFKQLFEGTAAMKTGKTPKTKKTNKAKKAPKRRKNI